MATHCDMLPELKTSGLEFFSTPILSPSLEMVGETVDTPPSAAFTANSVTRNSARKFGISIIEPRRFAYDRCTPKAFVDRETRSKQVFSPYRVPELKPRLGRASKLARTTITNKGRRGVRPIVVEANRETVDSDLGGLTAQESVNVETVEAEPNVGTEPTMDERLELAFKWLKEVAETKEPVKQKQWLKAIAKLENDSNHSNSTKEPARERRSLRGRQSNATKEPPASASLVASQ